MGAYSSAEWYGMAMERDDKVVDWIYVADKGLFVEPADVYLDPVKAVDKAVVTHGHTDHARPGNGTVHATAETLGMMKVRYGLGAGRELELCEYGEEFEIGGVTFRLEPAGHVLGSAQVMLEYDGQRVVYSGDYKRGIDPTCAPFKVVECDVFITEATFGLPVFRNPPAEGEIEKLRRSMRLFPERTHVVGTYALGKCQRIIAMLRAAGFDEPIFLHGAMERLCRFYEESGVTLGELRPATIDNKEELKGKLVLAPPSAIREKWSRRLHDPVVCFASGWMTVRQQARQRGVELPLVISDHADWPDLLRTIEETGAREVWVTHGQEDALVHVCRERGLRARPLDLRGFEEEPE